MGPGCRIPTFDGISLDVAIDVEKLAWVLASSCPSDWGKVANDTKAGRRGETICVSIERLTVNSALSIASGLGTPTYSLQVTATPKPPVGATPPIKCHSVVQR